MWPEQEPSPAVLVAEKGENKMDVGRMKLYFAI